ncbi:CBS domain-containing protein [Salisediminibacterium halotolerans]|uniref:Predicted transcriptional regulator containing CBS domains n=1 Tax=Salisediminibacterium halotolerans TaxID=517425 RepID=A0A1H9V5T7_9BACI|nr:MULTISPECIES: CBS domain-containing protein [Salisediminibacterium]RLJ69359.1 putative transcriptional regulator [Actinophytocola xinjiangensis]RPE84015.1 putative transcriptional regulator [Salisediminibacterium halotolerans]TWG32434.1 putative transcriptional regulator [Salisediminibacterium halotolerans]SES17042.1 Predicted transcriptional regulator containing CBS domains [Salisediminibacterium haloalkalitolerans]GEL07348.1 thioesterase [Salisediminibacterium halotolerans]
MTKHEQILQHIRSLDVGNKISVRHVAKVLNVSEGTAYRAIKDAENQGLVSTIERVGTIRIEKKQKDNIERLTYAEVVNIVDGHVIGGRNGLYKTLNKFVIGAMKAEAMMRYIEAGNLLIVGNREQVHKLALESGSAVLITGGFETSDDVRQLADELQLPLITTSYDTFTVATMINRAIYDQLIKKEIISVEDILIPLESTNFLSLDDTVGRWQELNEATGHNRYPVIDQHAKLHGMITAKDVIGVDPSVSIEKVMTKHPISVTSHTSVASAAHMMVWEGIELLPVIDSSKKLTGVISRQDVLKALQMIQRQPHVGDTIEDLVTRHFEDVSNTQENCFQLEVTPQMTNHLGTISYGVLTTVVTESGSRVLRKYKKGDLVVENITIFFIKPVQIDAILQVYPRVLEVSRKFGKVDVEVYHQGQIVGKAMLMAQLIDR